MKIEKLIIHIPDSNPIPSSPPILILDPFLKEMKNISDDCFYFYNKYVQKDMQENQIVVKLKLFFELILKNDNQKNIVNLKDDQFLFLIRRMLIVYLISYIINNRSDKDDYSIYLFKELYLINEANNDNSFLNKNIIKNIYKSFCNTIIDIDYKDKINRLKALFVSMDNENKKINISKCFLNILEKEIESSSLTITENRENMGLFLDFILNFFPDDFIPLIELFSNGTISNLNDITNIERLFRLTIFSFYYYKIIVAQINLKNKSYIILNQKSIILYSKKKKFHQFAFFRIIKKI